MVKSSGSTSITAPKKNTFQMYFQPPTPTDLTKLSIKTNQHFSVRIGKKNSLQILTKFTVPYLITSP